MISKQQGQTLIELIIFIVVMGIVSVGALIGFNSVLKNSHQPGRRLIASQLADARMNLILMQREEYGFANISDPCSTGALAACTGLQTFAQNAGYTVSSSISPASGGVVTATITVSGAGNATVTMRFVQ